MFTCKHVLNVRLFTCKDFLHVKHSLHLKQIHVNKHIYFFTLKAAQVLFKRSQLPRAVVLFFIHNVILCSNFLHAKKNACKSFFTCKELLICINILHVYTCLYVKHGLPENIILHVTHFYIPPPPPGGPGVYEAFTIPK